MTELFSADLKFTINILNNWFSSTIKPKFLELHDNRKYLFIKENPLIPSETTCAICGFLLDVEANGNGKLRWYDLIVDCEHLFLRNIYEEVELKKMKIYNFSDFYDIFDRLINLYNDFELALDGGLETSEFTVFY